jgi:hypothetical protein
VRTSFCCVFKILDAQTLTDEWSTLNSKVAVSPADVFVSLSRIVVRQEKETT